MITTEDVKKRVITNADDTVIQSFIDAREEELKQTIGVDDLSTASYQSFLKKWLLNMVASDIILYEVGMDPLDYSLGELRENMEPNLRYRFQRADELRREAETVIRTYFLKTTGYRSASP